MIAGSVALSLLRSESGREWLAREVVSRTGSLFAGELSIGAIEGDFTSRITLRDVVLLDREGRRAVAIGSLSAEYSLGELIDRLHVKSVAVDRLEVQAFTSSAGLNLAHLMAPSEEAPEPEAPPSEPPALSIGAVRLTHGRFALDGRTWAEELDLALAFAIEQGRIQARAIELAVDGAKLSAPLAQFDISTSALDAALELAVPGALVSRLASDPELAPDVSLAIVARHRSAVDPWHAQLTGALAGAPLAGSATVAADFARISARVSLRDVDPHQVHGLAPRGRLDLDASAALDSGRVAASLEGSGTLTASTASLELERLSATAAIDAERIAFTLALDGRAPKGKSDQVRAAGVLALAPPALEETKATVRITSLRPYLPPSLPLDAAIVADASASGPFDTLSAKVKAEVLGLTLPPVRVARIDVNLALEGLPGHPSGRAELRARELAAADVKLASLAAELELDREGRGTIALRSGEGAPLSSLDVQGNLHIKGAAAADLALSRADALFRGARLSLAPAFVSYGPDRIEVNAELGSPAGAIHAKASLDSKALLAGPGTIEIRAPDLSLAGAASLLPEPVALAGRASLSIAGEVGPKRDVTAEVELAGVSYRGSTPIGGTVAVHLQRALSAELALDAVGVARVRAELASRVPLDPLAWAPRDLVRATVSVAPIDLAAAAVQASLFGAPKIALAGTASIAAEVLPIGDRLAIHAGVQSSVRYESAAASMVLTASAAVSNDPSTWSAIDHRALVGAELSVEPIALAAIAPLAGLPPPLGGRIMIEARATAGLERIAASVQVEELQLELIPDLIDAEVRLDASPRRVNAVGVVKAGSVPALTLEGTFGAGVGDLLAGATIVERAPIDATLRLLGFPLAVLGAALEQSNVFAGELTGTATVGGTLAVPRASLRLEAKGARVGAMDFDRFRVAASYQPELATADLDLRQTLGGSLGVRSRVGLEQRSIELNVKASRFAIDFLNDVIPEEVGLGVGGRLDSDLVLTGKPEDLVASGTLSLSDGRLLPPPPLGTIEALSIDVRAKERSIAVEVRGSSGDGSITAQLRSDRSSSGIELDGTISTDRLPLALGKTPVALDLEALVNGSITSEETRIDVTISGGQVEVEEREARDVHSIDDLRDVVYVDARGARETERKKRKQEAEPKTGEPSRTEITVKTAKALPVTSKELKGKVEADLRISSGRAFGKVTVGDGAIELGGRDWRIERARIDLDGSLPPRPVLDVLLIHEFESVVVSIFVTGTPDHPEVRFEASPAIYDQAALLGFVLGGDPDDNRDVPLENKAAGAAANYFVGALSNALGQDLWLDTLAVEAGEALTTPKLQLGKWITREIFLGYEHNFGSNPLDNRAEAIVRYRFLPGWMVESRVGDKEQGLDLFWTKRF